MDLTLDLSPMLVNRTAVFQICMTVKAALDPLGPKLQYFGEARDAAPSDLDEERLKSRLGDLLQRVSPAPGDHISTEPAPAAPGQRRVFLDPLYVLFSDLTENDFVLIHDLSPLTTPSWHSAPVSLLYQRAYAKIARAAPSLAADSHNTAETYYANLGYPRREIRVVHLFMPDHVTRSPSALNAWRPYFLFVGSLEARKNITGAIEAFRLSGLAERGYELLIAGGGGHGEDATRRLGETTPGVRFCGFVPDAEMAGLYAGATGFVYPSYLEGFGVPLLEALGHGVPSVATLTGACPEVGGELIAYADPDDHVALAAALQRMAALEPAERASFAQAAQCRVRDHFGVDRFRSAFLDAVLDP